MDEVERTINIIASNPEIFKQTSISEKVRVGFVSNKLLSFIKFTINLL
jgi:hypothetical protein